IRLEANLEYDKALPIVEHVIAEGRADRDRLIGLHMMAGRLAAGLDRADVAEDHFARALALDPARTLPEGTSPKLTAPLEAARAHTKPLRVSGKLVDGHLQLSIDEDDLHLVARQETIVTRKGEDARAYDDHGNIVWVEQQEHVATPPH